MRDFSIETQTRSPAFEDQSEIKRDTVSTTAVKQCIKPHIYTYIYSIFESISLISFSNVDF